MGEVNYFSSKIVVERNIEAPTIVIPSIGVNEKISLSYRIGGQCVPFVGASFGGGSN